MPERFDRGDLLRIDAVFTDTEGDVVDPATVTFSTLVRGERTDYAYDEANEVTKIDTGHYRALISLDTIGDMWLRVEATGAGQAAAERRISVVSAFK